MASELDRIKERAARTKFHQVYDNQAEVDREYLLNCMALMESAIEVMTMEESVEGER